MARNTQLPQETFEESDRRIAILIDGDNAQASLIEEMLVEAGKYGNATIRRVYGDWSSQMLRGWTDTAQRLGLVQHQQTANTKGKNATDSAMIIDAMDLLYSGNIDAFALMTSDSAS